MEMDVSHVREVCLRNLCVQVMMRARGFPEILECVGTEEPVGL